MRLEQVEGAIPYHKDWGEVLPLSISKPHSASLMDPTAKGTSWPMDNRDLDVTPVRKQYKCSVLQQQQDLWVYTADPTEQTQCMHHGLSGRKTRMLELPSNAIQRQSILLKYESGGVAFRP